jgi:nitroimidazol reductase NimA-like FMN-containing flavoprotein (pyridoxamine 5'-phosphate oxidase superfamily)
MVRFSNSEVRFLEKNEIGRFATASTKGMPHVVPVSYLHHDGFFWIAVDYDTKKYRNLLANNRVALLVDVLNPNRGILVQGRAEILERGPEFRRAYEIFYKRFSWVRADPWKEGEAPFVKIVPLKKASWGIR